MPMPIFFTTDPLGCVIQCGDEGLYLAVLATSGRGGRRPAPPEPGVRRRRGQIFRQIDGERRVQLMHLERDNSRWRVRIVGGIGIGSVSERVLARHYVLEETAYG